jgi:CheY-like chemotaxis protein
VNSLNYSPPGTQVSVTVGRSGGAALLEVSDNGMGVEPEELPRLFDLFYQSPRAGSAAGGLGLGLTLVRRLVELHGGTIRADSRGAGAGMQVTVSMPAIDDPMHETRLQEGAAANRQRKIVLVDDDRDVLESLRLILVRNGHTVLTAPDGESGLKCIRQTSPDVAIIDIGMPNMDGYEVAARVRAQQLPVYLVALTGYGQVEDKRRAHNVGFDAHLTKPADLQALQELISEAP